MDNPPNRQQYATVDECSRCLNTSANPAVSVRDGLCNVCAWCVAGFQASMLRREMEWILERGASADRRCLLGLSGGKDSTATMYALVDLGYEPVAFTLDTGYYPEHMFTRAKDLCDHLSLRHIRFDVRPLLREVDRQSYRLTAALYGRIDDRLGEVFRQSYLIGRTHYSAKCSHALA